jgi:hypothetical protein
VVKHTARTRSAPTRAPSKRQIATSSRSARQAGPLRSLTHRAGPLHLAVLAGFVLLSALMWWGVWFSGHAASTLPCQCGDPALIMGWVAWLPQAILHGHNPLYTNALYAGRGGVNALTNTSSLAPSLVVAPITMLFGAVAGFNVALTFAPAFSAWCMYLFVRRVTPWIPAQLAAGLLWGFSPFVFDNIDTGHLFVAFGFFPPLAAIIIHDVLIGHRRRPRSNGILAGLLVTAQFFTGTELLALSVIVGAVGILVGTALAPAFVWNRRRDLLQAFGVGLGVSALLLAYPVWFLLAGPRHITGHIWPASVLPSGALSGIVNGGSYVHQPSESLAVAGYLGGQGPSGLYLGWALLIFLAVSAVVWRRRRLAWCALAGGLSSWVLTQGSDVHGWWWPWHVFARLPVIAAAWPARFSDLTDFCAALLLAVSMDEWWKWLKAKTVVAHAPVPLSRPRGQTHRARRPTPQPTVSPWRGVAALGLVGIVAGVFVSIGLAYSLPFTVQAAPLPAWFSGQANDLSPGTRFLAIPYSPVALGSATTAYQAQDSFRLDLAGGYQLVPGTGSTSAFLRPITGASQILQDLSVSPDLETDQPAITKHNVAQVRGALRRWGVQVFVVLPEHSAQIVEQYDSGYAVRFMTAVYDRPPLQQDGARVWHGLPRASR